MYSELYMVRRKRIVTLLLLGSLVFSVIYFTSLRLSLYYSGYKLSLYNSGIVDYHLSNNSSTLSNKGKVNESNFGHNLKYILLWTDPKTFPFIYFGSGSLIFQNRKCKWNNCYVTSDRFLIGSYTEFDAVLFNGPQLTHSLISGDLPMKRSLKQKYVYANIEAAANYPICTNVWNRFFNWTWTYKLNSDAVWGYFVIKDIKGNVIGPRLDMQWLNLDNVHPMNNDLKLKLSSKTKAAAWFVSNCNTLSRRELYVRELMKYLEEYNLNVDIYGECGNFQCPKDIMKRCLKMLENNYYFYFALENAFSEDYVTEKILHALKHNTVPIVFGSSNYDRFLPPGSYLNALKLGTRNLAKKMYDIMNNQSEYLAMFKWKKYYTYHFRHENPNIDDYCLFCAMMNNITLINATSIYENFDLWWSGKNECQYK